jgi:hypothetical protein
MFTTSHGLGIIGEVFNGEVTALIRYSVRVQKLVSTVGQFEHNLSENTK